MNLLVNYSTVHNLGTRQDTLLLKFSVQREIKLHLEMNQLLYMTLFYLLSQQPKNIC